MKNSVTWKIGGEAGFGIISAGTMFARTYTRAGYHALVTNEYPSLIRGGHNLVTVRIATEKIEALNRDVHVLVALNRESVDFHKSELQEGSVIIYDPKDYEWNISDFSPSTVLLPVPFSKMVQELKGEPVMRNTVALGASMAVFGGPFEGLAKVIEDQFANKGNAVIDHNVAIARAGYEYVGKNFSGNQSCFLSPVVKREDQLLLNASEAVGLGAVRAGLKFAAIYPMTPINALISFLADHAGKLGIVYKQPEDEIAGIMMAIGASLAGVRSMVATSGGGFALMVEGLSFAGMIEVPLVIDLGMRVGPATGMPTWTEQAELQFAIHAGHGEFPRIVLAPSDAAEAYEQTIDAFNLADRYQVPVFVLTDKYINESQWCAPVSLFKKPVVIDRGKLARGDDLPADGSYRRYSLDTQDGVSLRSTPGMKNGHYYANSYEHDETGHVTEKAANRVAIVEKRLKKMIAMKADIQPPSVYGDVDGEITFVSWGSCKGPVLEAMKLLKQKKKSVRVVHFSWIYPFPVEETKRILTMKSRMIIVEQNVTGQLASLIREHTGIEITEKLLKYDGRPWYPEELVEKTI
ncbi:2-oxoacid:acceptor oxidoreductase subunit alpha [Candidatus Gottesmanbacteria bacterium]|nr:2-oxoacid:acceptor oxidoreductase subunit alpha [Candidatus Gottesmanbacteria bacterium]